jgi:hypothetical protein
MEKSDVKSKYYVPDIKEFRVGFEFEKYDDRPATYKEDDYKPTNWHKFKYDLKSIRLSQLPTHLYEKTIRVKYLDEQDINSFGFTPAITMNSAQAVWDKGKYRLHFKDGRITIHEYMGMTLFTGTIKNKSELKVLLTQLGIL